MMQQGDRGTLEDPTDPALVRSKLRDRLGIPVERLTHVELLPFRLRPIVDRAVDAADVGSNSCLFPWKQLHPMLPESYMSTKPTTPGRLDVMDQESLNERETRAWVRFQHMRIEVNVVLARMLTRDFGLTEADFVILLRLSNSAEYRLRARDMAGALQWDRSRLSRQVSRMETRGTVRRAPSEGDARGYDVALTDAGRAAFQAAWPSYVAGIRHCFADVLSPDQLDALTDIAETIDRHFTAQHCPGGLNDPAKADGARTTAAGLEFRSAEDSLESA